MPVPHILALDLSLTETGYCYGAEPAHMGVVKCKGTGVQRLQAIRHRLHELISYADMPHVAVIEGYAFGASGRSVFDIGELGGMVKLTLADAGIPVVLVPPAQLKKYATGKGNANKDAMISAAIQRFHYRGQNNNEADAFLLWCMARQGLGWGYAEVPKDQRELAQSLAWPRIVGVNS